MSRKLTIVAISPLALWETPTANSLFFFPFQTLWKIVSVPLEQFFGITFVLSWGRQTLLGPSGMAGCCTLKVIRDFKIQRRGRYKENVKKTIGLISKTTTLHVRHAFLYISLPFLHNYDVNMPNFAFYGGRKQATTKFNISYCTRIWCLPIQLQEGSPTFDKVSG